MIRIIARIETQNGRAVKGRRCEGVRPIGDPAELAARYYDDGADELILQDVGASLYGDPPDFSTIERVASRVFVPMVVAGGFACAEHVETALGIGVERVAFNTATHEDPRLLPALAQRFGASSLALLIEAKRYATGYRCHVRGGREARSISPYDHIAANNGNVAEVLLSSVDRDGDTRGPDCALVASVLPAVASGGIRSQEHAIAAVNAGARAVALASALHSGARVGQFKEALKARGYEVRA